MTANDFLAAIGATRLPGDISNPKEGNIWWNGTLGHFRGCTSGGFIKTLAFLEAETFTGGTNFVGGANITGGLVVDGKVVEGTSDTSTDPGGTGGGTTTSSFSGTYPHDLLDLNDWQWQSPLSEDSNGTALGFIPDGKSYEMPDSDTDTTSITTYQYDPWFKLVKPGGTIAPYVQFRSPMKGSTSSTTVHDVRSEMRDMHEPAGAKSSWNANTGTHTLKLRLKVNKVAIGTNGTDKARVVLAQVHTTSVFGFFIYYDGPTDTLKYKLNKTTDLVGTVDSNFHLGTWYNVGFEVASNDVKVYIDDVLKVTVAMDQAGTEAVPSTSYFKWGCYNQENATDDPFAPTSYSEVFVAAAKKTVGAWVSGGYDPIGPGVGAGSGTGSGGTTPPSGTTGTGGKKPYQVMPSGKGLNFDSGGSIWNLTDDLPHSQSYPATTYDNSQLIGGSAHEDSVHFVATNGGAAVQFRAHCNGNRTSSGTKYPRCELREVKSGTTLASWNTGSGTHILEGECAVTHVASVKPDVIFAQIHAADDDLTVLMVHGGNLTIKWGDTEYNTVQAYTLGTFFKYKIEVINGTIKYYFDFGSGFVQKGPTKSNSASGNYFKAGCYNNANVKDSGASASDYGEVLYRYVQTTHSPAL